MRSEKVKKLAIHLIAAARPNFMKIAPLYHALKKEKWVDPKIIHTGQHYDLNMSDAFFKDLKLPEPDIHLNVGSGTHADQTGQVMIAYEKILEKHRPNLIIVVGDVNSTLACTLAATKINYSVSQGTKHSLSNKACVQRPIVAHLEAGLRSFDRSMPEEINRIVTDVLADILWTPSPDADTNLANEGVTPSKVIRVGNIMIDSLEMLRDKIESLNVYKEFNLNQNRYGLVTLHRPSNVDERKTLTTLCNALNNIAKTTPLIFPVHPRTLKNIKIFELDGLLKKNKKLFLVEPISYIRFMNLVFNCQFVLTDSGGIQEETSYLNIPCLTLRANTERPITVEQGTNQLCTLDEIESKVELIRTGTKKKKCSIEQWDGKTSQRVVASIKAYFHFQ